MDIWIGIALNAAAIVFLAIWPRPNHADDMREMFNISKGTLSQARHRLRRWRRKLPPAARVTTLVIQRAFGPVVVASIVSVIALFVTAYVYQEAPLTLPSRATAVASNTLERLSQGALSIPGAAILDSAQLPIKALLASFTFVITMGLLKISQQWLLSILRTAICLIFREGSFEVLTGDTNNRPRLASLLGVSNTIHNTPGERK